MDSLDLDVTSADGAITLEGELAPGVEEAELLDFLAADLDPVPADPAFRDKLRDELWGMVAAGVCSPDDDPSNR